MTGFTAETYLGLIALGFGVGAYGTLIGAGGGFVLMPILLIMYPRERPELLTAISLAVVFFNALSGSEAYARMKRIDYKSGLIFACATIPGAVIGALSTAYTPRRLFDVIFGTLLLAGSIFLILRPSLHNGSGRKFDNGPHQVARHLVESDGLRYDYTFNPAIGIALSLFVGYVSSFLGIGGGIIHVPALVYLLSFPVHVATATSHFILVIMALTGTIVHIMTGTFHHGVHRIVSLAIGVVIGAQLGAQLSQRIKGGWIVKSLAIALGLVGLRILITALEPSG